MGELRALRAALRSAADPSRAAAAKRFFKTGPGEYAEGDRFLGIAVPTLRTIARAHIELTEGEIGALLTSPWHEERFVALRILAERFRRGDGRTRARVVRQYLAHLDEVNNWDLVDTSAYEILGEWLIDRPRSPLHRMARSRSLWRRRIAMVATWAFIRRGESADALEIADKLLHDEQDLMRKATGWMLREVGKRCGMDTLVSWLRPRCRRMPRTTLRYAIERFPAKERRRWLRGSP